MNKEYDVFLALPSKCCDSSFVGPDKAEFQALIDELRTSGIRVYCPLEEVSWDATAVVDDPAATMKHRLEAISHSRHVVAFPQVGDHTSSGVTMIIAFAYEREVPLTVVLCGEDAFASEWQLAGLVHLGKTEGNNCDIIFYTGAVAHCWEKLRKRLGAESVERLELSSSECPWGSKYQWYWDNRTNFFSRWYDDNGNQLIECDVTGIFTVKPEAVANDIANHLIGDVVLDAFAGVGGVSIALARSGKTVIAVEKDANRAKMLKHNAFVYGVEDRICIVSEDVFSIYQDLEFDSIYLDPPWGGPSYKGKESFQMRHFRVGHRDVVKRMRQLLQFSLESEKSVGFTVPNNFDFPEFSTFCRKICESPNMRSSPQHMSLRWGRIDHRVLFMTVFMNSSRNASTVAN